MTVIITGIYDSFPDAIAAVGDLQAANIRDAQIRLVAKNIGTNDEEAQISARVADEQAPAVRAVIGDHERRETLVTGREATVVIMPLLA
jgi:hypothetical protein